MEHRGDTKPADLNEVHCCCGHRAIVVRGSVIGCVVAGLDMSIDR
jgi:hypothetical protein